MEKLLESFDIGRGNLIETSYRPYVGEYQQAEEVTEEASTRLGPMP